MSKKRRPSPAPQQKPAPRVKSAAADFSAAASLPEFFNKPLVPGLIVFAFAFLLYANTLGHGFVLDDSIVIADNMYTTQGVKGVGGILSKDTFFGFFKVEGKETLVSGGRYRPFTLVLFAVIYQFSGNNPFVFHLFTILAFAATCVLFYRVLRLLLKPRGEAYAGFFAWIAAMLFAAHPIHTEVTANIKGCDEIFTLMGSLGALYGVVKAFDTGKTLWSIAGAASFFAACLSKENAATFLAIIPLALWFFRKADMGQIIRLTAPVFVAFILFFVIRGGILNWRFGGTPMEIMNNPYLKIEGNQWVKFAPAEKLATICYTLWKYVQLLFVPHPLTHDYYPNHISLTTFGNPVALLGLFSYIGLAVYAFRGMNHRDPLRFGILFYLLSLSIVSNIVFPVGTHMGERFAFMPSVGFCIAATALLLHFFPLSKYKTALTAMGIIAGLYGLKTLTRNPAWSSNENLFFTDVATSGNSAKIRNACGGILFDKARLELTDPVLQKEHAQKSLEHLNKAIELHPNYKDAYVTRGGDHFILRNFEAALADYRRAAELGADPEKINESVAMVLRDWGKFLGETKQDFPNSEKRLLEAWKANPKDGETARLIGVVNGVQGRTVEALGWFEKAYALKPEPGMLFDLGNAHSMAGNAAKGEELRKKALEQDPQLLEKRRK